MGISPNLSEEVMLEAINKEYDIPASLLTLILQSNPHAAKSSKVQKELDERTMPLEEYQREMINEGLELVSFKEQLEASKSHHEGKVNFLLNQIIHDILSDSTEVDKIAAIESAIDGYAAPDHYYLIVDLYLNAGKLSEAQAKLNQVGADFELDPRRDAEYADYLEVYGVLFDKISNGINILTQTEMDLLVEIAYKKSTLAAGLALSVLYEYADYSFLEVLVEPDLQLQGQGKSNNSANSGRIQKDFKERSINLFPNPTRGIVFIKCPIETGGYSAEIYNVTGSIVKKQTIDHRTKSIDMRDVANGTYLIVIRDEKNDQVGKWNIIKTN